jgi:hypothetical protein
MGFGDDHRGLPEKPVEKTTEKMLPVLVGYNYEHVMGKATIVQTPEVRSPTTRQVLEPARVTITIVSEGANAQELGDFVAANEVVALSFGGVPVRPVPKKEN